VNATVERKGLLLYGVSTESRLTRLETIAEMLVTREDLNKAVSGLHLDIEKSQGELRTDFEKLRYDLEKDHGQLRSDFGKAQNELRFDFERSQKELRADFEKGQNELRADFGTLRTEFEKLRADFQRAQEQQRADLHKTDAKITRFMLTTMVGLFLGLPGLFFTIQSSMKSYIESALSRAVLIQSQNTSFPPTTIHQPIAP